MASATAMGMDIMGRPKSRANRVFPCQAEKVGLGIWLMLFVMPSAYAKIWDFDIKPSLATSQIYSDNFGLQSSSSTAQTQGGFATLLAPALNIVRDSPNVKFNLSYRLQFIYYEGVNLDPQLYNQLQMTSKTEIYDDSVFVDSTSTIGQGNATSIGAFSPNNVTQSSTVNTTTYRTFRISPYWLPHLGGYAEGEVRVGYSRFDNTTSANPVGNGVSSNAIGNLGSDTYQESVYLRSGKKMDSTGLSGRLSLSNQEQDYSSTAASNLRFRSVNGELSYRLVDHISAFVQAGYYDNAYSGTISPTNGIYATPGLSWTPSPQFTLAAGYGINAYFANLTWNPSQRTTFLLNYRDSQVGGSASGQQGSLGSGIGSTGSGIGQTGSSFAAGPLGASSVGSIWTGSMQHRTRTTTWKASYYTTTTTIQDYLASQSTFTTPTDVNGNPVGTPTANNLATNSPNYTNGVIVSKVAQLSVSWFVSKNTFQLSANQNNITYSTGNYPGQDILGFSASWNYRFSPRLNASIQGTWQSSSYSGSNAGKTEYLMASMSINRPFSSSVMGSLQFTHYQTNSGNVTTASNLLDALGSYDSNQVTASLNVKF